MARVVITPASLDYDPTEVAIPWAVLRRAGHEVVIATASGVRPEPDLLMLRGEGLDPWSCVPGLSKLAVVGRILGADANARRAHAELEADRAFLHPIRFADLDPSSIDALVLPGGHRARGIRPYLEDPMLHAFVAAMFDAQKPVGAICHGVVVAARATSPRTGRSVLHGLRTTSLTWAQERLATRIACVTRFWDPTYYRTYVEEPGEPAGHRSVQAEVTRALADPADYRDVPRDDPHYARKTSGRVRDTADDDTPAFVVRDGAYVSARWPGDAHTFARTLDLLLSRGVRDVRSGSEAEPTAPMNAR